MAKPRKRRSRRYRPSSLTYSNQTRRLPRPRVEIDRGLAWYAVFTSPRAEPRILEKLAQRGLASYRPVEAVERIRRGRRVEEEIPAISRYVFIGLNAATPQWGLVHDALEDMAGIQTLGRVLRSGDVPLRVPASALQRLADGISLFEAPTQRFIAGEAVRAVSGPFLSFLVTVEEADDYRVRALVDIFGRQTPVEFEPEQLEAA